MRYFLCHCPLELLLGIGFPVLQDLYRKSNLYTMKLSFETPLCLGTEGFAFQYTHLLRSEGYIETSTTVFSVSFGGLLEKCLSGLIPIFQFKMEKKETWDYDIFTQDCRSVFSNGSFNLFFFNCSIKTLISSFFRRKSDPRRECEKERICGFLL